MRDLHSAIRKYNAEREADTEASIRTRQLISNAAKAVEVHGEDTLERAAARGMKIPRDIIARTREIIMRDGGVHCSCGNNISHAASCSFHAQHKAATDQAWRELRPEVDE